MTADDRRLEKLARWGIGLILGAAGVAYILSQLPVIP